MDARSIPGMADAAIYPIEEARAAWLALAQRDRLGAFMADAFLAKHLPAGAQITGTVDDLPYDRLPAFLADCKAALVPGRLHRQALAS